MDGQVDVRWIYVRAFRVRLSPTDKRRKMRKILIASLGLLLVSLGLAACGGGDATAKFPGTKDGAKALIGEFMKPDVDRKKLTMELRPTKEDYKSFYAEESEATRAEAFYDKLWNSGEAVIAPKDGQTELRVFSATPKQLNDYEGEFAEFPTSMISLSTKLKPDLTIYAFKFVKPGETSGMAYEGLTHVNGRWRLFPKPWRYLESK